MTILITGPGFLGKSVLAHCLHNTKEDIYTLGRSEFDYPFHRRCDILDVKRLKEVLNEVQPTTVFHLSANPLTKVNEENPSQIIRDNIEGFNNLLSLLKNRPKVILSSSATVFGFYDKENPPTWLSRCSPRSLYALTKLSCEGLLNLYNAQNRTVGVSVRIPGLVGLNASHGILRDVIQKAESDSEFLELIGEDPGSRKPYLSVDDCSKFLYKLAVGQLNGGYCCCIGPTDSISAREIGEIVLYELGIRKEIKFTQPTWAGDNREIYISPCFKPLDNSREAIIRVLKEYKELKNGRIDRI